MTQRRPVLIAHSINILNSLSLSLALRSIESMALGSGRADWEKSRGGREGWSCKRMYDSNWWGSIKFKWAAWWTRGKKGQQKQHPQLPLGAATVPSRRQLITQSKITNESIVKSNIPRHGQLVLLSCTGVGTTVLLVSRIFVASTR